MVVCFTDCAKCSSYALTACQRVIRRIEGSEVVLLNTKVYMTRVVSTLDFSGMKQEIKTLKKI